MCFTTSILWKLSFPLDIDYSVLCANVTENDFFSGSEKFILTQLKCSGCDIYRIIHPENFNFLFLKFDNLSCAVQYQNSLNYHNRIALGYSDFSIMNITTALAENNCTETYRLDCSYSDVLLCQSSNQFETENDCANNQIFFEDEIC